MKHREKCIKQKQKQKNKALWPVKQCKWPNVHIIEVLRANGEKVTQNKDKNTQIWWKSNLQTQEVNELKQSFLYKRKLHQGTS